MSTYTIPDFLVGQDLTLVTVTLLTKSGGTLTAGTVAPLSGYIDAISINPTTNLSRRKSVDTPYEMSTATYIGASMTITEIQRVATSVGEGGTIGGPSFLASFANQFTFGVFAFTKGSGADSITWKTVMAWGGLRDGFTDSDVASASIDLSLVDTFSYPWTISGIAGGPVPLQMLHTPV